jgi:RNA polymerase sigma factor (sigma-70 family)
MAELTQGEEAILEQVRRGSRDAWAQLLDRYEGRLLALARSRAPSRADAEDLVQETFIQFLKSLPSFRGEASVETYLFMILRRRIIDALRGRRLTACLAGDLAEASDGGSTNIEPAAAELSASRYVRRAEDRQVERAALLSAMGALVERMKDANDFRNLQIAECLFYAQLRNKDIGRLVGVDEKHVALIKHRWLKDLRAMVGRQMRSPANAGPAGRFESDDAAHSLLTEVWEEHRLSCPKRSTVGGFMLGTLDEPWHDYVDFHVNRLGCRFCRANLDDLRAEAQEGARGVRERVMQSTIGFFAGR